MNAIISAISRKVKGEELFKFSWTIENVTIWDYDRSIMSPCFEVEELGNVAFYLAFNEKGKQQGKCSLLLHRKKRDGTPEEVKIRFRLKISNCKSLQPPATCQTFKAEGCWGWTDYVPNLVNLQNDDWRLLSGKIHIECTIFKPEIDVHHPMKKDAKGLDGCMQCSARTRMKTSTVSVKWNVEHFSTLRSGEKVAAEIVLPSEDFPRFLATLYLTEKSTECETVQMNISNLKKPAANKIFVACKVTLGGKRGAKIVEIDKHVFDSKNTNSPWELPVFIRKCELVSKNKNGLLDDVLPILLEFKVEEGMELSRIEKAACELVLCSKKPSVKCIPNKDSQELSGTKQNFLTLLREQKLCDVRLETQTKTIGAHKAILCGNSPVFAAMFEHNTLEKETKTVQVVGINFETLERFLASLYTESLAAADLDVERAFALYFAADYYQVDFLKRECSNFLKNHLQVENVCDVLTFADRHQDRDLIVSVGSFIGRSKRLVLDSEEWKALSEESPKMVIEVLEGIICTN